jgi:plasmid maintenance system killer protein
MIFKPFDKGTAAIFVGYAVRDLPQQIQRRARAKLLAIDAASLLDDLRVPPGNRLDRAPKRSLIKLYALMQRWQLDIAHFYLPGPYLIGVPLAVAAHIPIKKSCWSS